MEETSVRTHTTTVSVHVKFLNNCHPRTHCALNSAKFMLWSCFRRFFFSLLLPESMCFLNYLFGEAKPHRAGLVSAGGDRIVQRMDVHNVFVFCIK